MALLRSLVTERLEEMTEFLQVFTKGSVCMIGMYYRYDRYDRYDRYFGSRMLGV